MNEIIPLTHAEIHVWLTFCDDITDECLLAAYRELLNAEEKEQELRFYFARDRRRYLITRALVRTAMSRYVSIHPTRWIFSKNAYGRPEIANPEAREAGLSFNISHSHSVIVLGVTNGRALGVDVEDFRRREASLDVAECYFTAQEVAALMAAPPHQRRYRFFEYWTFKEAYIKARSMGLSLPLDKFSFRYPDDHAVEMTIHPDLGDDSGRWQFWQFRPAADHLAAICAERARAHSPKIIARRAIPMRSEQEFSLGFLRESN